MNFRTDIKYVFLATVLLVACLLVAWAPVVGAQGQWALAVAADSEATGRSSLGDSLHVNPSRTNLDQQLNKPGPVLYLADGDQLAGRLMPSSQQNVLRWQGDAFTEPFDFTLGNISAVQFPMSGDMAQRSPALAADFGFELAGGDLLYGNLVGLTADRVELEVPGLGRLQVRRKYLRRMVRRQGEGELIYLGPNQRTDWLAAPSASVWREDAGHLVTDRHDAMLRGNFSLPAKARIEIELSWENQGNFVLALGATEGILETRKQALERAFRLEVWEDQLVALKESDSEADVAALARLKRGAGRIHLLLYLDQTEGYLRVLSAAGQSLGEVRTGTGPSQPGERLWLLNRGGRLRLEGIRVSHWDGSFLREGPDDRTIIERLTGPAVEGTIERFDLQSHELVLAGGNGPRRVRLDEVAAVQFKQVRKLPPLTIRASFLDGSRLRGELLKVEGNHRDGNFLQADRLWMVSPAVVQPLAWPVDQLRSLVVLPAAQAPAVVGRHRGYACRLEAAGTQLHGALVAPAPAGAESLTTRVESKSPDRAEEFSPADPMEPVTQPANTKTGGASCLLWQPRASTTASPLKQTVAARIVYRDPPAPKPRASKSGARQKNRQPRPQPLAPGVWGALMKALADQGEAPTLSAAGSRILYLRSGDTVLCDVTRIDSEGVHFKTPLSDVRFVSHDQVKVVVLAGSQRKIVLSKSKRLRLLTLPRMHRENPPTHLVCSMTGDYLRGRLLGMDDRTLRMEVRLESVSVGREKISHIIWLHENELEGDDEKGDVANPPGPLRVQAVRSGGVRMTFIPGQVMAEEPDRMPTPASRRETRLEIPAAGRPATALLGVSQLLGECRIDLDGIDRLLLGGAIEQEAAQLAPQGWTLYHAQLPKIASTESGNRIPGTAAALVGHWAPDFQLVLHGGETFRLRDCLGQIVVLDFWASWCGPCMQTMPQIDRLVREFPGDQVRLVAINLQETPEQITSTLQRHGLETVVALDQDGVVAEKYTATAIPHTVVIDREGHVARLFVGGGPQLVGQLREALESMLEEGKPSGP